MNSSTRTLPWGRIGTQALFLTLAAVILVPIVVVLFASFKTPLQIAVDFPLAPPTEPTLANWATVFSKGNILQSLMNSLVLVVVSVSVNAFLASSVAYCISRFRFPGKKLVMALFLIGMMVPGVITEITRFSIIRDLGAYNTLWGPMLIYIAADMMQLYVFLQFMNTLPVSLDESAMIDGCSYYQIYLRIIVPLIVPAIATLSILKMLEIMNDMYIPYLYMPSPQLKTLSTILMYFSSSQLGTWNNLSAALIIVMLPTTLMFLAFQKAVFRGIAAGAVKE